ncbi:polysaccharide biosynthesis/export family protein [Acinetobacter radioresistens]|uniref:polysaccharide biosynthesis/export family protein n=2 Tax=Acinetobacter radioresistens TaxID=40216 RepID=UPI0011AAB8DA|nr:polysaccharide biosynthesis/export family protein [Acinetobacter radioresistens]WGX72888.1 polysaccharide biosynthesis/export family protein [Acinetobacter radioresistens]
MKFYQALFLLGFGLGSTGCAITSGFQTYNLPEEGVYQTELGTPLNIVKITQDNLSAIQPATVNFQRDYAHLFQNSPHTYLLSPGDVLSIQLWAYPEISGNSTDPANGYQIDQSGYIHFPMIGRYKAAGKSLVKVNQELRSQLSRYLKTPDVIARVISYQGRHISIFGNVEKSGQINLNDQPMTLYNALSIAGGAAENTSNTYVQLIRNGMTYDLNIIELERAGMSLHNLILQPNDTIYVSTRENQKIYVMGEASKNQALSIRDQGMSLGDVLGESQGINPLSASAGRIYVLRTNLNDRSTELYHLDLSNIGDFGLANQFKMRNNDVVYIDSTGLTRWQRVIGQIVPFSNAIYSFDRLGN